MKANLENKCECSLSVYYTDHEHARIRWRGGMAGKAGTGLWINPIFNTLPACQTLYLLRGASLPADARKRCMPLIKTLSGQQALKERQGKLTMRQRSAFILFDGKRSLAEVLAATAPMGITQQDVQAMLDQGLLEPAPDSTAAKEPPATSARSDQERYQQAYLVATQITGSLGLRGFRLNLSVESASGLDGLIALGPKIREAVGDAKYEPLKQALFA